VLKIFLVCGIASYAGGNVFRSSQSTPCTTAIGSESLCSWFDQLKMVRMWTGVHARTVFPGVEEPSGTC